MNNRTLTSANAILLIGVDLIFPVAQRIQGFSTDDLTDMDNVEPVETAMGIDGRLSAGFVPVPTRQNITLQADSESNDFFDFWHTYERGKREKVVATGTLIVPGVKTQWAMTRGFLRSFPPIPALRKSAQPRRYTIEWERVVPAPYI
ncbi:hypothetical protein GCM10011349_19890 [Novosphingobium indicum]|uniref:Uncharacterized protein n=1 Tax=Novosphingobium indicum TaxID=462949 RepID=A0ABQ2JP25_9SPHN|nr:hypothetical protein [Novosphingobium indicum]GGN49338.1 hypothetical protein GCM10011349_19890 [Novosphingobium indicum]